MTYCKNRVHLGCINFIRIYFDICIDFDGSYCIWKSSWIIFRHYWWIDIYISIQKIKCNAKHLKKMIVEKALKLKINFALKKNHLCLNQFFKVVIILVFHFLIFYAKPLFLPHKVHRNPNLPCFCNAWYVILLKILKSFLSYSFYLYMFYYESLTIIIHQFIISWKKWQRGIPPVRHNFRQSLELH